MVDSASNRNEYQEYFLLRGVGGWGVGVLRRRVRRADNLTTFIADWISGSLDLLEPSEIVQGLLYL